MYPLTKRNVFPQSAPLCSGDASPLDASPLDASPLDASRGHASAGHASASHASRDLGHHSPDHDALNEPVRRSC